MWNNMTYNLINKRYKTPIGVVNCGMTSNKPVCNLIKKNTYKNGQYEIYETVDFQVELVEFKIKESLYNGDFLTDLNGWIWKIIKK